MKFIEKKKKQKI